MKQPGRLGKDGSGNSVDITEEKQQRPEAINKRRANLEGFGGMNFDLGREEGTVPQVGDDGNYLMGKHHGNKAEYSNHKVNR